MQPRASSASWLYFLKVVRDRTWQAFLGNEFQRDLKCSTPYAHQLFLWRNIYEAIPYGDQALDLAWLPFSISRQSYFPALTKRALLGLEMPGTEPGMCSASELAAHSTVCTMCRCGVGPDVLLAFVSSVVPHRRSSAAGATPESICSARMLLNVCLQSPLPQLFDASALSYFKHLYKRVQPKIFNYTLFSSLVLPSPFDVFLPPSTVASSHTHTIEFSLPWGVDDGKVGVRKKEDGVGLLNIPSYPIPIQIPSGKCFMYLCCLGTRYTT